jgi:transcriptional regulator with XRE-family HTH domain
VVGLLFCYPLPLRFKALISNPYSESPRTLGEHIMCARLMRGLRQRDVASIIGADLYTVINWEKDRTKSPVCHFPGIIVFLGYDPFPLPQSLSERMLAKRRAMGWSIAEAARQLGVDRSTWGAWERDGMVQWPRYQSLLEHFLAESPIPV